MAAISSHSSVLKIVFIGRESPFRMKSEFIAIWFLPFRHICRARERERERMSTWWMLLLLFRLRQLTKWRRRVELIIHSQALQIGFAVDVLVCTNTPYGGRAKALATTSVYKESQGGLILSMIVSGRATRGNAVLIQGTLVPWDHDVGDNGSIVWIEANDSTIAIDKAFIFSFFNAIVVE